MCRLSGLWQRLRRMQRLLSLCFAERTAERGIRVERQKEYIIARLKEKGCRITRQRLELLDVILTNQCASCKEIHYLASKVDDGIGIATVYRMVNELEDIGVISRKIVYEPAWIHSQL